MRDRKVILGALAALAIFALGFVAARLSGSQPHAARAASVAAPPIISDAGARDALDTRDGGDGSNGPKIMFDPSSINLLPDASLRLDLPQGFDGGAEP